ncbi:MAG: carboxypeptidase-like regulatory domain-containing protein, partial [Gemmatimonadota bacterium]
GAAPAKGGQDAKKEDLTIDKVVPLPGPMPRPAAPSVTPPAGVRREAEMQKFADAAAKVAQSGVVQGRVFDAATGAPVVGATVSVDTARVATRTDSAGRFQLDAVPLGQQTVSVRAMGFQRAQHQLAVVPQDSAQLGFTLQRSSVALEHVVTTGQAQARPQAARDAANLNLNEIRANSASIIGCYTLRVVEPGRNALVGGAGMPSRIELEARAAERAQREEPIVNRARKLTGDGEAVSWRFVGDSLEVTVTSDGRSRALRFGRENDRWVGQGVILERCGARPPA